MANIITSVRILCGIALVFCFPFSRWFYGIYILGGLSDVLDGIVARSFGNVTKLGAQLDTIADIVFLTVVIIKVIKAVSIPAWVLIWILCIAAIKGFNIVCGFVLFNRFVAEHTVMNKLCGILLFVLPICIGSLPQKPVAMMMILTCILASLAAVQEGHYIRTGKEVH